MGGKNITYILHNRFYHALLHLKLCWTENSKILCSVASDRVIYGWNIDNSTILFQVSRHTDLITDFISIDHLNLFATSSMDRRIVVWSATTRRVKGVFIGHLRGVKSLSCFDSTLLSGTVYNRRFICFPYFITIRLLPFIALLLLFFFRFFYSSSTLLFLFFIPFLFFFFFFFFSLYYDLLNFISLFFSP